MSAIAKNASSPDIISQKRKEQSIFSIAFEAIELRHKVSAEQRVRLPLGHIRRKMLPLLKLMPITHIGITALSVKSLKEIHTPQHAQKEEAEQKQSSAEPAAKATGSRGKTNRTITYASRSVFELGEVGLG